MSGEEHIGIDVHQATISVAVMESRGWNVARKWGAKSPARRPSPDEAGLALVRRENLARLVADLAGTRHQDCSPRRS
jgi:hypothetical protein